MMGYNRGEEKNTHALMLYLTGLLYRLGNIYKACLQCLTHGEHASGSIIVIFTYK